MAFQPPATVHAMARAVIDFTGTPTVADGCMFAGSNGGWVFAVNADTGALVWKAQVPAGGGINGSVTVENGLVYAAVSRVARHEA